MAQTNKVGTKSTSLCRQVLTLELLFVSKRPKDLNFMQNTLFSLVKVRPIHDKGCLRSAGVYVQVL